MQYLQVKHNVPFLLTVSSYLFLRHISTTKQKSEASTFIHVSMAFKVFYLSFHTILNLLFSFHH